MQIGVCQARIDWSGDDIINASNTKIKLSNGNNLASKISPSLRGEKDLIKTKRSYFLFKCRAIKVETVSDLSR